VRASWQALPASAWSGRAATAAGARIARAVAALGAFAHELASSASFLDAAAGALANARRQLDHALGDAYGVEQSRRGSEIFEVFASIPDGGIAVFGIGTSPLAKMTLTGESACVERPGA
jgi:hypothetical protein